jgi:methyl-accepting chemotaxis protein
MKSKHKFLIIILIFTIIMPSVQANVFDDVRSINQGIIDANKKLDSLQDGIDEMNNKTKEVSDNVLLIKDTNQGIQEMSDKLDEVSNKMSDAIEKADKVDNYVEDLKLLMLVGIGTIILAILTLIGATIVLLKKRK